MPTKYWVIFALGVIALGVAIYWQADLETRRSMIVVGSVGLAVFLWDYRYNS